MEVVGGCGLWCNVVRVERLYVCTSYVMHTTASRALTHPSLYGRRVLLWMSDIFYLGSGTKPVRIFFTFKVCSEASLTPRAQSPISPRYEKGCFF
jgi:hypothetical protein